MLRWIHLLTLVWKWRKLVRLGPSGALQPFKMMNCLPAEAAAVWRHKSVFPAASVCVRPRDLISVIAGRSVWGSICVFGYYCSYHCSSCSGVLSYGGGWQARDVLWHSWPHRQPHNADNTFPLTRKSLHYRVTTDDRVIDHITGLVAFLPPSKVCRLVFAN